MQERGRMQEGMVADITIFDPETVTDHATYKSGKQGLPSSGIPWVIVNGQVAVKDSRVQEDVYPGQPIRYPVADKPRFVPLSADKWIEEFSIRDKSIEPNPRLSHLH